jgi:hypothetical protein
MDKKSRKQTISGFFFRKRWEIVKTLKNSEKGSSHDKNGRNG